MEETKVVDHDHLMEHLSQGFTVKKYLSDGDYLITRIVHCCEGEDSLCGASSGSFPPVTS